MGKPWGHPAGLKPTAQHHLHSCDTRDLIPDLQQRLRTANLINLWCRSHDGGSFILTCFLQRSMPVYCSKRNKDSYLLLAAASCFHLNANRS